MLIGHPDIFCWCQLVSDKSHKHSFKMLKASQWKSSSLESKAQLLILMKKF